MIPLLNKMKQPIHLQVETHEICPAKATLDDKSSTFTSDNNEGPFQKNAQFAVEKIHVRFWVKAVRECDFDDGNK